MSKSIKFKNNNFLSTKSIEHKRYLLYDFLNTVENNFYLLTNPVTGKTFELLDNFKNYKKIEIFYWYMGGMHSAILHTSQNKIWLETLAIVDTGYFQVIAYLLEFNNNIVNLSNAKGINIKVDTATVSTFNVTEINIQKIVGYK